MNDWKFLQGLLAWFTARFGRPSAIALKRWIPRGLRDRALAWLRILETLARRLIVRDALAAPRENRPWRPTGFPSFVHAAGRAGFASDDSADWGVSFRLSMPTGRKRNEAARKSTGAAPERVSACALAERLEALLRVVRDPTRWVRRLARRLRALPREARSIVHRITGALRAPIVWPTGRTYENSG